MKKYTTNCKRCFPLVQIPHRHEGNRYIAPDTDVLTLDAAQKPVQALRV